MQVKKQKLLLLLLLLLLLFEENISYDDSLQRKNVTPSSGKPIFLCSIL